MNPFFKERHLSRRHLSCTQNQTGNHPSCCPFWKWLEIYLVSYFSFSTWFKVAHTEVVNVHLSSVTAANRCPVTNSQVSQFSTTWMLFVNKLTKKAHLNHLPLWALLGCLSTCTLVWSRNHHLVCQHPCLNLDFDPDLLHEAKNTERG